MYIVSKRIEISAAHKLALPYDSSCRRLHGHNWVIEVEISCEALTICGMVIDFTWLKEVMERVIKDTLDHKCLNDVEELGGMNPTAENLAKWIATEVQNYIFGDCPEKDNEIPSSLRVTKVIVQESAGNKACYIP